MKLGCQCSFDWSSCRATNTEKQKELSMNWNQWWDLTLIKFMKMKHTFCAYPKHRYQLFYLECLQLFTRSYISEHSHIDIFIFYSFFSSAQYKMNLYQCEIYVSLYRNTDKRHNNNWWCHIINEEINLSYHI